MIKHGHAITGKHTKIYWVWRSMLKRCRVPSDKDYSYYGARGISVCERWLSFENFLHDMGEPTKGYTLDRIDNDGNYEPSNCRWVTRREQTRNQRKNIQLTYAGKTMCLPAWAEQIGINASTLTHRIYAGWSAEKALTTKVRYRTRRLP